MPVLLIVLYYAPSTYYVTGSELSIGHIFTQSSQQLHSFLIAIFILHTRKLKHKEVKQLDQSYTICKGQN